MPRLIQIIDEDERLMLRIDDAVIYHRRVPSYVQRRIEHEHTEMGEEDRRAIVDALLQWAILGWEGIVDQHRQPIAYSASTKDRVIACLPEAAKGAIIRHLFENDPGEAALKNSAPISTVMPSTEG
jgi:DNA-binding HxlR family transcriptional regulator